MARTVHGQDDESCGSGGGGRRSVPGQPGDIPEEGEGIHTEFKRRISSPEKLAREVCALANSGGGKIIIGVTDDGRVCGTDLRADDVRTLLHVLDGLLAPVPAIRWERSLVNGKRIVLLHVPAISPGPCRVHTGSGDRILVRVGDSNRDASPLTVRSLGHTPARRGRGLPAPLARLLKVRGRCTAAEFAEAANISHRRARRTLVRLVRQGRLISIREGPREYFA